MRIAVVGKGGVGKTVLSTLLARALQEAGRRVLAVDFDTNPGLAISLGLEVDDQPLPDDVVQEREGTPYGWGLADGLSPGSVVERYAVPVRPGLSFLSFGNIDRAQHVLARFVTAVQEITDGLDREGWSIVGDIEAGPSTPFEGYAAFADVTVVLVPPSASGVLAARRIVSILDHTEARWVAVGSGRHPEPDQGPGIPSDLPLVATIPYDPNVQAAERVVGGLLELDEASPAVAAARSLAHQLLDADDRQVVAP